MVRYYMIFKGLVQGVGFRYTMATIAIKHNITGWVRNLDNGDVSCEVQGKSEDIDLFLKDIFAAKGFIRIDDYHIKKIALKFSDSGFKAIY